jgi:hypothetical protein
LGCTAGRTLEDVLKGPKILFLGKEGHKKRYHGCKTLMFQWMKIKSHILELMEVKIISWKIYMVINYQRLITNYIFNNLFKQLLNILLNLMSIDGHW